MSEQTPATEARKTPEEAQAQAAQIIGKIVDRRNSGRSGHYETSKKGQLPGTTDHLSVTAHNTRGVQLENWTSNKLGSRGTITYLSADGTPADTHVFNSEAGTFTSHQIDDKDVLKRIPAQLAELRGSVAAEEIAADKLR